MKFKPFGRNSPFINGKKFEKIVALRTEYRVTMYKQMNILKIDNDTDCLGNEIILNKNKKM